MEFPDGDARVGLLLSGRARDLRGSGELIDESSLVAEAGPGFASQRRVVSLHTEPARPQLDVVVGGPVGGGLRAAVQRALPDVGGTTLGLLLDDIPVAALISGYAGMRSAALAGENYVVPGVVSRMADLCSGWRTGGEAVISIGGGHGMPRQDCPRAPSLEDGDPLAWHSQPVLPTGAMRRRRRIDVWADGDGWVIDAMFRDTFGEPEGHEGVLHEYTLLATIDADLTLIAVEATPRVLPFEECPWAAPNVGRLVGQPVGALRQAVPDVLGGVAGCTHLNDLLRALADAPALLLLT
jgi:hypothetical protein